MSATRTVFLVLGLLATLPGCGSTAGPGAVDLSADDGDGTNPRGTFTISKETTRVTGPIDQDGYVDFAAAINKRMREGVTPDTNANVLLWKAHGPRPEGGKGMPPEFFEELGIPAPPEDGDYFIDVNKYMRANAKIGPGVEAEDFSEKLIRLAQRPWTAKEHPEMASWLKANDKPLALVVEATGRPHYYSPLIPPRTKKGSSGGLIGALLPGAQKCREFASALAARAMLRVGEGAYDDAWRDLIACHRLGRLVGRGPTLIEGLVAVAIDGVASLADLAFLDRAKPDARKIERCLRDLRQLPPLPDVADKVDLGDRFMFLDSVLMIDRHGLAFLEGLSGGKPKGPDFLDDLILKGMDWDPALEIANRWYDRTVAALRIKDRASRVKELNQLSEELRQLKRQATEDGRKASVLVLGDAKARGEFLGSILIALMMPAASKLQDSVDRATQTQDNLTVAFALAWYQLEHGRYPENLDALAPKYLPRVPSDLFSGKALVYRPSENGYLLYSVGINGIDEGGRTQEDNPPGDDLSVRLPLPDLRRN
jgi:hypothetical protein